LAILLCIATSRVNRVWVRLGVQDVAGVGRLVPPRAFGDLNSIAVIFDFVQPLITMGLARPSRAKLGLDEARYVHNHTHLNEN
jgi:hypothetical protein